ncbi:BON domain-containing protein [Pseudomonas sp. RIT-PI-S]|uniref:BON domain-containing protein n=1 Tax=Pseudomonas sp. RIT-PI-S TaxID=3035295 RepID=UPI0021D82E40|nr:BON domain-containing protein [Pseudomonas sp. RIT-PI-S]
MIRLDRTLRTWALAIVLSSVSLVGMTDAEADSLADARSEGAASTALALNSRLAADTIKVQVAGPKLTLTGSVESEGDKTLAGSLAQAVTGAATIDNRLTLDPALAERPPLKPPELIQLDDLTLAAIIRARLSWNRDTAGTPVSVEVAGGVVTLKGEATTVDAKEWAGALAADTDGSIVINNLISLRSAGTGAAPAQAQAKADDAEMSDAWISSKVASSLQYDRGLDALRLEVKVKDGMVTLAGEVDSDVHKKQAMEVTRRILGVRGVDADLLKVAVKPSA